MSTNPHTYQEAAPAEVRARKACGWASPRPQGPRRVASGTPSPDAAELIEADVRAGRREQAEARLASFAVLAEASDARWALARAAYLTALLAEARDFDDAFHAALLAAAGTREPLALPRCQLAYGERLRRAGRRAEARVQLRAALLELERLDVAGLASRAREELLATTEQLRRESTQGELTERELQVARVIARGVSNKEAGAQLFLSPKTIEKHLGAAFAKLGVRSRAELALLFAREPQTCP
jgi:ATP/maltotriose-dependent transcriptional regulator MalT